MTLILKDRPKISVILTRNSVCATDDCDAPHKKTIRIYSFFDPEVLAREASSGYLSSVAGVGHTWICVLNDTKVPEITMAGIKSLVREATFNDKYRIHFQYKSAIY